MGAERRAILGAGTSLVPRVLFRRTRERKTSVYHRRRRGRDACPPPTWVRIIIFVFINKYRIWTRMSRARVENLNDNGLLLLLLLLLLYSMYVTSDTRCDDVSDRWEILCTRAHTHAHRKRPAFSRGTVCAYTIVTRPGVTGLNICLFREGFRPFE